MTAVGLLSGAAPSRNEVVVILPDIRAMNKRHDGELSPR